MNTAASVRTRLLNTSNKSGEVFQSLLLRYAIERFLFRLGRSIHKDAFLLKGAMLFVAWGGRPHRPTKDLDQPHIWTRKCHYAGSETNRCQVGRGRTMARGRCWEAQRRRRGGLRCEAVVGESRHQAGRGAWDEHGDRNEVRRGGT
ncbi:MAG: nucleotidyl transferase AbiEii/AbiGii toxin family protein [Acidobacteria bacterium]|nr:nucleotidyl transferase AbiEii/AbiGii toxin family protein [Acidobacteriota bacterium]MBM3945659.1 nucleotidyl transferase AbiEii/AbiGii toxin family protein [SAR202 cluster bacterium]